MSLFRTGFQHSGLSTNRFGFSQQLRNYYGKRIVPKQCQRPSPPLFAQARTAPRLSLLLGGSLLAVVGLSAYRPSLACESSRPYAQSNPTRLVETQPESMVNIYQLTFGTICGICAGIFIKKGAKFIAFLLGGAYVLLQYLNSQRLVTVNWNKISSKYDGLVNRAAGPGAEVNGYSGSVLQRLWGRTTDFLTADFQPRATFMAGLVLGLRLG